MENYVALLTLNPPLDAGGLHRLWRQACLDLYRVEWTRAYLAQDGGRMLCWYRAPDAESVRFILRQLGDGESRVWRSEVSPDDIGECAPGGTCCVAVEVGGEHGPDGEAAVAVKAALTPALAAAGFRVIRQFSAPQGERQVCLLQGQAEGAVRDCLRTAGLPVDAVWACVELDPAPQTLFRSTASAMTAGDSGTDNTAFSGRPADRPMPPAVQPKVYSYLQYVVEALNLRPHIRTGTRVAAARYIDAEDHWQVIPDKAETVTAHFLIAATGALTAPQLPAYPGLREFSGDSHHTARWPASGVDLTGRRVGVIGTGATGVQVIQTIAAEVGQLTVFQRTPTYCIPQRNRRLSASEWRRIQRELPSRLATCRASPAPGAAAVVRSVGHNYTANGHVS